MRRQRQFKYIGGNANASTELSDAYTHTQTVEVKHFLLFKCVDTWMMRRENSPSHYTQTYFPIGVVQGSECLPVITTAIDQSDQRKLEVDWLDASVKSGDASPPLSHSFPFLLLLCCSPFLYHKSSPFLSAFLCSPVTVMGSLLPFATTPTLYPIFFSFPGSSFILRPREAAVLSL